jgi:hypothetical protein
MPSCLQPARRGLVEVGSDLKIDAPWLNDRDGSVAADESASVGAGWRSRAATCHFNHFAAANRSIMSLCQRVTFNKPPFGDKWFKVLSG